MQAKYKIEQKWRPTVVPADRDQFERRPEAHTQRTAVPVH